MTGKPKKAPPQASFYKDILETFYTKNVTEYSVQTVTLDGFLEENGMTSIDLLKIDVEGHELKVLEGAKDALTQNIIKRIQFEFDTHNVFSRTFFRDFWELLSPYYNLYRLLPYGNLLPVKEYNPLYCEMFAYQNYIAISKKLK